jgi:hypothetical protein
MVEAVASSRWDYVVVKMMQFAVFMLCYYASRIFFSPTMWRIYFWETCWFLGAFLLFCPFFTTVLSDAVVGFCVAMCLPPYVTQEQAQHILYIMDEDAREKKARGNRGVGSNRRSGFASSDGSELDLSELIKRNGMYCC